MGYGNYWSYKVLVRKHFIIFFFAF
jgi:hypothetical protein